MDKDIDMWKQRNEILHKKVNRQMAEIKDLHKKGETMFDLARRFPNKTYRELEKYRDADRQEEAEQIPLSESQKKQEELEPIEGEEQDNPELFDWKELTIVKGISVHMSPEMRDANKKIKELRADLDSIKKDNNDLFLRIAELTEVEESHRKLNGKLQERLTEVEEDNKKLANQIEDKVNQLRRSGL